MIGGEYLLTFYMKGTLQIINYIKHIICIRNPDVVYILNQNYILAWPLVNGFASMAEIKMNTVNDRLSLIHWYYCSR